MPRFLAFSLTYVLFLLEPAFAEKNTTLLFVQFLYRHGDRNPIKLYPNDPNPESVFPGGLAQLTSLGKKQHYELGKYFRSLYKNFTNFTPSEIFVLSSSDDRCVMSAQCNLATFFAPDPKRAFEDNVSWQPIPVRYVPKQKDRYLEVDSDCPKSNEEEKRVLNSPEGQQFLEEHKEMYERMSILSGMNIVNWTIVEYFQDVIFIEKKFNLTVPTWVEPYYEELKNVSNLAYFWRFNSPLLHRLRAGPLLQRIIENMNRKIKGELKDQKFQIFSAHDENIAVVLSALNLYNFVQPPYCATLLFELHEMADGGEKTLRMLYLNSTKPEQKIEKPHILVLDGCTEFCPLSYFINYTKDLMPEDWERECELDKSFVEKINNQHVTIGWFFVFVAVVLAAMSAYVVWRVYSRKQEKKGVSPLNYNSLGPS